MADACLHFYGIPTLFWITEETTFLVLHLHFEMLFCVSGYVVVSTLILLMHIDLDLNMLDLLSAQCLQPLLSRVGSDLVMNPIRPSPSSTFTVL